MESLALPSLTSLTNSSSKFQREQHMTKFLKRTHFIKSSRGHPYSTHHIHWRVIKMKAVDEDYELKQMRDMAAAKKRWDALLRNGKVKVLTTREAGYAIQLSNKTLLDVRPSTEREKARVKGSTWIPIFEVDDKFDAGTLSRKVTNYVMGGWWSGVPTLSYDKEFLLKVEEKFPKDTDLIVACQKGLRSLAACELLYNAGYTNLFWVQGGLEAAENEDLVREGPQPFKFAGIGGVSEFLGWTDQQRAAAAKEGWGYRFMFSARLVGIFLVADALFIASQQVGRYLQDIKSH
ncbi:Rhodanese domain-containing protein [Cephalotus follicularis]|uniref:Rhodanese domain-containing protein n=1 Tax=Cephalotus follicularis TaxID=3775 RepID=A0A1Q3BAV8_CEPFO|nr:Rhodanese domain-containing protein [Cephalotus follicularis]